MRSYNVLLFTVLVAISYSNAFEFTNLAEVKALRSSSYGNSLIETISMTLQSAGNIEEVTKLLDELLFKLNHDQQEATKAWDLENARLKKKIEDLTEEIEALKKQIALDKAEKLRYEGLRDQAIANLEQYRTQLAANLKSLEVNEVNRKRDIEEYQKSVTEHNDVINAIEAVVAELSKLIGSVSGDAKPVHVEEIEAEKRDREYALQKSFAQLTKDETETMLFIQMATQADQAALAKLIELLNTLSNNTKQSLNQDEEHEANSKASYELLKSHLTEDNEKLDKAITEQDKNLKTYTAEIERLAKKIQEEEELQKSKETEKASAEKERAQKEEQYKSDKAERENEAAVIKKLQKIVEERLANMSKFLSQHSG